MKTIEIGNRKIGINERPYFIADIAANHDGDLERAYKLIELAKEAGADVAKFQNFTAKKIVSRKGFDTLGGKISHQASWEKSVFDVYEDASIPERWTVLLKKKCDEVGIEYMTSPYDFDAIDVVEPYVNAYKIGSGDITWLDIIRYMGEKKKPVLLATGASSMEDVERAMSILEHVNDEIVIMQCNTNYTAKKENFQYINLNVLKEYKNKYPRAVLGISDHTFGYETVLGAIALGARVIEKHFTDDNNRVGPDHKFSMNPKTWREMVDASMNLFYSLGDGNKKIEENEIETARVQRRGIYTLKQIEEGDIITKSDITVLRPMKENGIEPYSMENVIGKKVKKSIQADCALLWEDIQDEG